MDQAKAVYFVVAVTITGRTPAEIRGLRTPRNHAERHLRAGISIAGADLRADERIDALNQIGGENSRATKRDKKNRMK